MRNSTSLQIYKDTYFLPNETFDTWLDRMSIDRLKDNEYKLDLPSEVLKTIREYIKRGWFHPSTPISSNLGTNRGYLISCFVREAMDDLDSIFYTFNEGYYLSTKGSGLGTLYNLRSVGEDIANGLKGTTSGVIPFIAMADRSMLAISQGGIRRASEAVYLDISHPEILEFIDIRKPDREPNRSCANIHHGVVITDAFMHAVLERKPWDLIDPHSLKVKASVDAFDLFCKILDVRVRFKGEPFIFFVDNANANRPWIYKKANKRINLTNLCTEIALHTSRNKANICCLGSINLAKYDEFKEILDTQVVPTCLMYLDAIVSSFIRSIKGIKGYERALKGAMQDRALGLGVMGYHSYLQSKMIAFSAKEANDINEEIFSTISLGVKRYENSTNLDSCLLAKEVNLKQRNATHTAIAPTMSISMLCDGVSGGVEPIYTNYYTKKLKQGVFTFKNIFLDNYLKRYFDTHIKSGSKDEWLESIWDSIKENEGSIMHLDFLSSNVKEVFKTAFEIDQNAIIYQASKRGVYIDQSQSINLFFKANSNVKDIYNTHIYAWKKGLKSLYYLRSSASSRVKHSNERQTINVCSLECEVCQ